MDVFKKKELKNTSNIDQFLVLPVKVTLYGRDGFSTIIK